MRQEKIFRNQDTRQNGKQNKMKKGDSRKKYSQ